MRARRSAGADDGRRCERVGVDLDRIEDITAGCVNPAHEGMGDIARWAALAAGFPDCVAGGHGKPVLRLVAERAAINDRARDQGRRARRRHRRRRRVDVAVRLGADEGRAPFSPRGPVFMLDTMWAGAGGPPNPALLARNAYIEMIETAQNVADRY